MCESYWECSRETATVLLLWVVVLGTSGAESMQVGIPVEEKSDRTG
jgi:hypothetical protein